MPVIKPFGLRPSLFSSVAAASLAFPTISAAASGSGSGDCNVNGIPDAAEIAAGLVEDCNGNGLPDPCEYAGVLAEGEIGPFGDGNPLVVTIADAAYAASDLRLSIEVRADLDAIAEFVQVYVADSVVASLWLTDGASCPGAPQMQTVIVPMATVNAAIDANGGDLVVSLVASGVVGVKECPDSFAFVAIDYVGDLAPADCLGNGTWDGCDIAADPSLDCDGNGLIDLCEIDGNPGLDCDGNGLIDSCEIAADPSLDCDGNGLIDLCEIDGDSGLDCDGNGLIDACEIAADPSLDCDGNGLIDLCEIDGNPGLDCDGNGALDTCDLLADPSIDCDGNGLIDLCEVNGNPGLDCDGNGLIDACEIASGATDDCNQNGRPDICDPDCDGDAVPDDCAIASGAVVDCNGNMVPDACDLALEGVFDADCDGNGLIDSCQIDADPSLDKNADGLLDGCQYARGDFDLDRNVGGADLALLLGLWGTPDSPIGDLNDDGLIDGADLAGLLGNWGEYTGPWGVVLAVDPDPNVVTDPEWRERIVATGLPWRVRDNASQIEMLLVPPGTFMMGCLATNQSGCGGDENPIHEVTLTQAFYLGRYEVTQAQWTAVMNSNPSSFQSPSSQVPAEQVPNRPVEKVSWNMIQDFEAATGLRLPTEAEWEYACRAGTQTAFNLPPNGTNDDGLLGELGWFNQNAESQTRPVGQKQANNLGLHDMHGNVWEWVEDWYGSYPSTPQTDPRGPINGTDRVLRGGSWFNLSNSCRASNRSVYYPSFDSSVLGFRVARTP